MANQTKTSADAEFPRPLENLKQWKHWEETIVNYDRSRIRANVVPLSYVIRKNEEPDINGEHPEFINKIVARALLQVEYYAADRMYVFNMVLSFTTGQPSSDWIKTTTKHSDRRCSMETICRHFSGEGNATRNLAEA